MKKAMLIELITSLLILLFVYTAASKLIDYERFTVVLEQFPFLKSWSRTVGWLLPVAEVAVAGLLVFSATRLLGLWVTFFLLLGFTAFLVFMMAYYSKLPCNCGGVLEWLSWPQHVGFNLFFIVLNVMGIQLWRRVNNITEN